MLPIFISPYRRMRACYNCNIALSNKTRTGEHVLPNAIGGRLVSYKLLCRSCNVFLGETIDSALALQFDGLCTVLKLSRDRPKRAEKPARDKWVPNLEAKRFLNESFEIDFDSIHCLFRPVTKIALGVYLHFGGDPLVTGNVVDILNERTSIGHKVSACTTPDPAFWRTGELSHFVLVVGSPLDRLLQATVTLFNSFSFRVILSDTYTGCDLGYMCRFDLLSHEDSVQVREVSKSDGQGWSYLGDFNATESYLATLKSYQENLRRILSLK